MDAKPMNRSRARLLRWLVPALLGLAVVPVAQAQTCGSLLDRSVPRLQDEKPQNLCQYAGKVVVVVNTASYCGFTPQYKGLEALHERYRDKGLVVLGFPSNDFGSQEPGSNQEVAAFCESTYGVKFPMFVKSSVKGANANPLYVELGKRAGKTPAWNFHKYVIARDGETVTSYNSLTDPLGKGFVSDIERLLGTR